MSPNSRRDGSSKPQKHSDGVRVACPFFRAAPDHPMPKTCPSGSDNMAHLKEHLSKYHSCECQRRCQEKTHMTKSQFEKIKNDRRRSGQQESTSEQWTRWFKTIFPRHEPVPPPYQPTLNQFESVAQARPRWFIEGLAASFRSAGMEVADQGVEEAEQWLLWLPHCVELISRHGIHPNADPELPNHQVQTASEAQDGYSTPSAASSYTISSSAATTGSGSTTPYYPASETQAYSTYPAYSPNVTDAYTNHEQGTAWSTEEAAVWSTYVHFPSNHQAE